MEGRGYIVWFWGKRAKSGHWMGHFVPRAASKRANRKLSGAGKGGLPLLPHPFKIQMLIQVFPFEFSEN